MKFMLLLGLIGHIFCGASDCLLTYAPNGKVNLTDFKDVIGVGMFLGLLFLM